MKKTKILVPAMGLLILGTAASVTGTVAWFSMNNSVAVTGMNVRTTVGSNILIATDNSSDNNYASSLNQPVTGLLEPVSTVNGIDFFYHSTSTNVTGDGSVSDTTFVPYVAGDLFDSNYGYNPTAGDVADCLGYVDYSFYIKATNGESAARNLIMSRCNLTYKGDVVGDKAWRVAFFAYKTAKETNTNDAAILETTNLKSILRLPSAQYFKVSEVEKAVASNSAFGDLNAAIDDAATVGSINSAATDYYKIIVRLWLEGNDTTCTNDTYASLTGDYRLDLKFELSASDGVANIGTVGSAVATASGLTATITLSNTTTGNIANGEQAASFQWYNAANNTAIDGATAYTYTAPSAMSVYCLVTTARGNVYRSNTVDLA